MRIGVPKEIKNHEHRVALTPAGAAALVTDGHQVIVQHNAGSDSGFGDHDYRDAGAVVTDSTAACWATDLVVKVKEPLACEYDFLRSELILFTFLHLAAVPELAERLIQSGCTALGYETVQSEDGSLPLLAGMSQVAGHLAAQMAARYLQKENGTPFPGKGLLPARIENAPSAHAVVLGAGNVGSHAATALAGLGITVTLFEASEQRIAMLNDRLPGNIGLRLFTKGALLKALPEGDILIGAALIPGRRAPELLKRDDLRLMPEGGVFIDVAIDQGGTSETSRPTSYDEPVYREEGIIHCCLPNLPAAAPLTSTQILTSATLPYIRQIANCGIDAAILQNRALSHGVNVRDSRIIHPGVRRSLTRLHADTQTP